MSDDHVHSHDIEEHARSYRAFVRGAIVVVLASAFTLVALCAFAFGQTLSILLGWVILIVGGLAILIDLRMESRSWLLSLGTLVLSGLLTAINVS